MYLWISGNVDKSILDTLHQEQQDPEEQKEQEQ